MLSPEPISASTVPNAPHSQTSVNAIDSQSDLASSRAAPLAEPANDESGEEEHGLRDHQLRRLYDDEEIERFLSVFAAVGLACALCR